MNGRYAMAESLPPQNKNAFRLASSNPFWALKKAFRCVLPFYRGCVPNVVVVYTCECVYLTYQNLHHGHQNHHTPLNPIKTSKPSHTTQHTP